MRYVNLAAAALLGLSALSALAQSPSPQSPSPQVPSSQAPSPQVRYGADPATGARPGHQPGTGESLPFSSNASNILPVDTRSTVAPTLPPSRLGENGATHDYLRAARASLVAGRTGQAQQSLEMAETRALDRSVAPDQMGTPSGNPLVARIRDARRALGNGDNAHAIQLIDLALSN